MLVKISLFKETRNDLNTVLADRRKRCVCFSNENHLIKWAQFYLRFFAIAQLCTVEHCGC